MCMQACVFPGLRGAEAHDISLPEKLEPLHILDLITKDLSLPVSVFTKAEMNTN